MGSSQTSTTNSSAVQSADPRTQAAIAPLLASVPGVASTPYTSSMNQYIASLNPNQLQGIGLGGNLMTNNPASPYIDQATQYSQMASSPAALNSMTQQLYNPMAQNVNAQLANTFGQQTAQLNGSAAGAGASGGSRGAVAASTLANQQALAQGATDASLYTQAQQAAANEQAQQQASAYTLGSLGNESLNTQLAGLQAGLLTGQLGQTQEQNVLNSQTTNAIQSTLFPQQEAAAAAQIAGSVGPVLGGENVGQSETSTPYNYLGAAIGLGTRLIASDKHAKENIEPIGKTFDKQTIYKFNYLGDPTTRIGLLAQNVEKKHPDAVADLGGLKAVDYDKATEKSAELGERKHRALGGATGIGDGTGGIGGYAGIASQDPLSAYFGGQALSAPRANFPQLPAPPSQQSIQQAQQNNPISQFTNALTSGMPANQSPLSWDKLSNSYDNVSNFFGGGNPYAANDQSPAPLAGANFSGGVDFAARGGRIHRWMSGGVDFPSDLPSIDDAYEGNSSKTAPPPAPDSTPPSSRIATPYAFDAAQVSAPASDHAPAPPPPADKAAPPPSLGVEATVPPKYGETPPALSSIAPTPSVHDVATNMTLRAPGASTPQPAPQTVPLGEGTSMPPYALDVIKSNENFAPAAHWDFKQFTGGYGTRAAPGQTYTPESAEADLKAQTAPIHAFISQNVRVPLTEKQYAGLADFAHNLGTGTGGLSDLLPDINKGDWQRVAQRMQAYVHAGGDVKSDLERRRADDAALVQNQDVPLRKPDVSAYSQPPREQSWLSGVLSKVMPGFSASPQPQPLGGQQDLMGMAQQRLAQPIGGSGLWNPLGLNPALSNFLSHVGDGMMAAGPTQGKSALGALTNAGKGFEYANQQDLAERSAANQLNNTALANQRLALEQQKTQFEMSKPQPMGSSVVYLRDPLTQMLTAHTVQNYGTRDANGKWTPLSQDENLKLNGLSNFSASPGSASPSPQPFPNSVPLSDGSSIPVPPRLQGKVDVNNPIDVRAMRVIAGQEKWPTATKGDPQALAVQMRASQLDPTADAKRFKYYTEYGGPNGKVQQSFTAFGTAIRHGSNLDRANYDDNVTDTHFMPTNWLLHGAQRWIGDSELKNYDDNARAYGNEHERTLVPTGPGTAKEREGAQENVSSTLPKSARLSGNAANIDVLLGKLLELDDRYNTNMGVAAEINHPQLLTDDKRAEIRSIFDHEPSAKLKQQRYDKYSKDPRTADLVSPPIEPPKSDLVAKATEIRQNREGHKIGLIDKKWVDLGTGEPVK